MGRGDASHNLSTGRLSSKTFNMSSNLHASQGPAMLHILETYLNGQMTTFIQFRGAGM